MSTTTTTTKTKAKTVSVGEQRLTRVLPNGTKVTEYFRVDTPALKALYGAMASKTDVREYIRGIFLDISDKKAPRLVATDGHILAVCSVYVDPVYHMPMVEKYMEDRKAEKRWFDGPIWRPARAPTGNFDGQWGVDLGQGYIFPIAESGRLNAILIESYPCGQFPGWRKVDVHGPYAEFKPATGPQTPWFDAGLLHKVWPGTVKLEFSEPQERRVLGRDVKVNGPIRVHVAAPWASEIHITMMPQNP